MWWDAEELRLDSVGIARVIVRVTAIDTDPRDSCLASFWARWEVMSMVGLTQ